MRSALFTLFLPLFIVSGPARAADLVVNSNKGIAKTTPECVKSCRADKECGQALECASDMTCDAAESAKTLAAVNNFYAKCQKGGADTDAPRAIAGWDGWKCADYKDGRDKSRWFKDAAGAASAKDFAGKCDAWANVKDYRAIAGWPGWTCADFTDGKVKSRWYKVAEGSAKAKEWDGKCDKWKK